MTQLVLKIPTHKILAPAALGHHLESRDAGSDHIFRLPVATKFYEVSFKIY